jgi:hypothetical protein
VRSVGGVEIDADENSGSDAGEDANLNASEKQDMTIRIVAQMAAAWPDRPEQGLQVVLT